MFDKKVQSVQSFVISISFYLSYRLNNLKDENSKRSTRRFVKRKVYF